MQTQVDQWAAELVATSDALRRSEDLWQREMADAAESVAGGETRLRHAEALLRQELANAEAVAQDWYSEEAVREQEAELAHPLAAASP